MGNLGISFPGNFAIWREILTFWIKKYIRNSGKFDHIPGKLAFFRAVHLPYEKVTCQWIQSSMITIKKKKTHANVFLHAGDLHALLDVLHRCRRFYMLGVRNNVQAWDFNVLYEMWVESTAPNHHAVYVTFGFTSGIKPSEFCTFLLSSVVLWFKLKLEDCTTHWM